MKYLGQLVMCPDDEELINPICVFLGYTSNLKTRSYLFGKTASGYATIETMDDLHFVRVKDKESPTGRSIYSGPFIKKTLFNHFKIKSPDEKTFEQELNKLLKLEASI